MPDGVDTSSLSPRQRRILGTIQDWVVRFGYPPTTRQIGKAVGLASPSSVSYQLKSLEEKGFLRRGQSRTRSVDVRMFLQPRKTAADGPAPAMVPLAGTIAAGGPILAETPARGQIRCRARKRKERPCVPKCVLLGRRVGRR